MGEMEIMKLRKLMCILFSVCLIFSLLPHSSFAGYTEDDLIEVEAAPKDVTIDTKGPTKQINYLATYHRFCKFLYYEIAFSCRNFFHMMQACERFRTHNVIS